jgi:hypothetical protein
MVLLIAFFMEETNIEQNGLFSEISLFSTIFSFRVKSIMALQC